MMACHAARPGPALSIIVPVFNEAVRACALLRLLAPLRRCGVELIVVDGGSSDDTAEIALRVAPTVLSVPGARGLQFNVAATFARGEVLLFMPRGVMLPSFADQLVDQAMSSSGRSWGYFDLRPYGGWTQRLRAQWLSLRAAIGGQLAAEHPVFVSRRSFFETGGVPEGSANAGAALAWRLRSLSPPARIRRAALSKSMRAT